MAQDAELDRLKAEQDRAHQRKQRAYEGQQRAWDRRSTAREAMNCAYDAKQRAYDEMDRAWQHYQNVRSINGPRIDSLNSQQDLAYHNMGRSYDMASSAYERGDYAGASSYSADGRRYKEESQRCVEERRRLVAEIRTAKAAHEATKPSFQYAKSEYNSRKREFEAAKAEHECAKAEFKQAKVEVDRTKKAFKSRLEKVRTEAKKHHADKRVIAEKVGIPHQYRDNVWISKQRDGTINVYFGGVGAPNGPGHGHYSMDKHGRVTYIRDPFKPHGSQNYTDDRGSTFYERGRTSRTPVRAEGDLPIRSSESGIDVEAAHITQVYDDKYRLSRDIDGTTDHKRHWTKGEMSRRIGVVGTRLLATPDRRSKAPYYT